MPDRQPQIKVHPSKDEQFYFVVEAANGQVLVTSETYETQQGAAEGASALVRAVLESQAQAPHVVVYGYPRESGD